MTTKSISTSSEISTSRPRTGRFWRILLGFILAFAALFMVYLFLLWPWMQTWGATQTEIAATLPGDDIVPNGNLRTTKGITIQAPPEAIYPWLLQIGVDRGGMYSYDWLENLFGLKVHTSNKIVPAYQDVQVGDFWRFTPEEYVLNPGPGLIVQQLIENEAVLLCFGMENLTGEPCFDTWQFVLQPQGNGSTRLLLRSNMAIQPELPIKLTYFIQFLMERKMLLTIRNRAETMNFVPAPVQSVADGQPQNSAMVVPEEKFDCAAVTEVPAAECQSLVAFFEATGGNNWADNTGWLENTTICSWYGVSCVDNHVDMLGIYYNNLEGTLPAGLTGLENLRVLDLHNNLISGSIPAGIGSLSHLEALDLSMNYMSGSIPKALGALTTLQSLNLAHNNLNGFIPAEIGGIAALRNVDFSYNQLEGTLPESLAGLSQLETIRLNDNAFAGTIPFGLGQLPALSEVDLSFNQLSGSAPSALFEVPIHRFWGNKLDGTIFAADEGYQDVNFLGVTFSFDPVTADSVWPELVPAVTMGPEPGMWWEPTEHTVFTLVHDEGTAEHSPMGLFLPSDAQIHIYPVASLNEEVGSVVEALDKLLASQPDPAKFESTIPNADGTPGLIMLPPTNATPMFRAQAEYIPFADGQGIRYLTQLSQGPMPANNYDLFYTFQGLSDDGLNYVAAYFPVSSLTLPDSPDMSSAEFEALLADWPGYIAQTVADLDAQPSSAFSPDLSALDALISTISVSGAAPKPEVMVIEPENGQTVGQQPLLQWEPIPGAVSYQVIIIDDDAYPPVVVVDQTTAESSLTVPVVLDPGSYSWTIWAFNSDGSVVAELNRAFMVQPGN